MFYSCYVVCLILTSRLYSRVSCYAQVSPHRSRPPRSPDSVAAQSSSPASASSTTPSPPSSPRAQSASQASCSESPCPPSSTACSPSGHGYSLPSPPQHGGSCPSDCTIHSNVSRERGCRSGSPRRDVLRRVGWIILFLRASICIPRTTIQRDY